MSNPFAAGARALGFTGEEKPTDYWNDYQTGGTGRKQIPPGRFTFRVPDAGPDFQPARTSQGYFALKGNFSISRGELTGEKVNFVYLSSQPQSWRNGSMAGDLVRATGLNTQPQTPDEWFKVAPFLCGKEFDAKVDLEVYDKASGQTLIRKAADLPKRDDGSLRTVLVLYADGTIANEEDEETALANGGRKVYANPRIVAIYPTTD